MNLQSALEEQKKQNQQEVAQIAGLLGIPLSGQRRVEVPNRNSYVFVRLRSNTSEVIQAYNNQVAPAYDLPVIVERHGNKYIVSGVDSGRYENNWASQSPFLPRHGNTHTFDLEMGGGGDVVWVQSSQFVPSLVFPSGSAGGDSVIVHPYTLRNDNGTWRYTGNTGTSSLAPYRPTSPTGAIMALVYLDSNTGNPQLLVNSGSVFSNSITGSSQITPYIPSLTNPGRDIPLAAVRLITGTNVISWNNIYDVRQWLHTIPTGSAGGISSVAVQDEGVPQGTATTFNFVGSGVQATISGSVARIDVSGGSINTGTLDARYLRLDTSNDPIYNELRVSGSIRVKKRAMDDESVPDNTPFYAESFLPEVPVADFEQIIVTGAIVDVPVLTIYRTNDSEQSPKFLQPAIWVGDVEGGGNFYDGILKGVVNGAMRTNLNPHATGTLINYSWDTDKVRPTGTIHSQWLVSGSSIAYVNVSGTFHSNGVPLVKEAPVDGQSYARKNAGWEAVGGGDVGGWISDSNTWSFLSADAPSYVVSVNANITGSVGVGMKTQLSHLGTMKNFFITNISVTGSVSYLNLYGGTDYTLTTGSITTPKYSYEKAPVNFPIEPTKWTVQTKDTSQRDVISPVTNTWYNPGTISISIPIGAWRVTYKTSVLAGNNPPANCAVQSTLSTANNSESDVDFSAYVQLNANYQGSSAVHVEKTLVLGAKTTYYLNARVIAAAASLSLMNQYDACIINAECAYL